MARDFPAKVTAVRAGRSDLLLGLRKVAAIIGPIFQEGSLKEWTGPSS